MIEQQDPVSIVLVEDDDDHAELALFHLERSVPDARITRVEDGEGAVSLLTSMPESQRVDLVLLDLKLPKKDGLEVLLELRSKKSLSGVPIVILSTSSAEPDRRTAYERGVNGYVTKPSTFDDYRKLMTSISDFWLRHNQPLFVRE